MSYRLRGKPSERMGRKVTGLSPFILDKIAELQSKYSNTRSLLEAGFLVWKLTK